MTDRRPEPTPDDEAALLDLLLGQLAPMERTALEARLAADPVLAAERDAMARLLAAERRTFEPAMPAGVWATDAGRVAAWVRSEARSSRTAARARQRAGGGRGQRTWARVLAFSVGMHVLLLGILAFLHGSDGPSASDEPAHFQLDEHAFREAESDLAGTELALRYQELVPVDVGDISDDIVSVEQETLADVLPDEAGFRDPATLRHGLEYPVGVVVPMSRRKREPLKRRRLHLLGFNAKGTMRAVERGLRYLRGEQKTDGSYPAGGGRSAFENTSLTLLAFLADGHCSRHAEGDASGMSVARGVAWVRARLASPERVRSRDADALALATIALCEDYMLSYGRFSPLEAQRRSHQIAGLTRLLRPAATEPAVERPWRAWALDAASRAGIIQQSAADQRSFTAWVEAASAANGVLSARDGFGALAVSTALLYQERGADKPRFVAWSRAHAGALVDRLSPIGRAKRGDPVGDTASILLALQVAYRTY